MAKQIQRHRMGTAVYLGGVDPGELDAAAADAVAASPAIATLEQTEINVLHPRYGISGTGDHTAAIQAVIDAHPGKTLIFPPFTYNFTTLNVTGDDTHLVLMAGAVLNKTTAFTDGLVVTGDNVTISGPGTIRCPASWNGAITAWTYAVVRVEADGFTADGVRLINIPKVGFGVRGNDTQILGCRITGNYPSASYTGAETVHFGITLDPVAASPKGDLVISGNIIRSCVQGVFVGNYGEGGPSQGVNITGNTFEGCWDHGVYATDGVGHVITGNTFLRCRLPVAVTGTAHNVSHNTMTTDTTGALNDVVGVSIRNAIGCVVEGNTFYGDAANTVIDLPCVGSSKPIRDNRVEANIILCDDGTVVAVRIGASSGVVGGAEPTEVSGNVVAGNTIRCQPPQYTGAIQLTAVFGVLQGKRNEIKDNTITITGAEHESYGIHVLSQDHAKVDRNTINWEADAPSAVVLYGLYINASLDCEITRNRLVVTAAWGANITMRGYRDQGTSDYNFIGDNHFLFDTTKLASAVALHTVAANSIRENNRTARAWPSKETGTASPPTVTRPNGSEYLNTTTGILYRRESGAWVAK